FIDADKTEYDSYFELILPRVRRNGLILFDNMLWGGRLGTTRINQASGRAIDKLNRKLARDNRVESVLLPIADGLQLCRKRCSPSLLPFVNDTALASRRADSPPTKGRRNQQ